MDDEPFKEPNPNEDIKSTDIMTRWMYYQSTIDELQKEKHAMAKEVNDLTDKLLKEKEDKADIYFYLSQKLDENYDVISSMEHQVL